MNALEEKQKVLAEHSVFSHLPVDDLVKIADTAAMVRYAPNDIIFRAGDEAPCMYIVATGEIAIQKSEDYVASTEIARLVAGDSLGELDMIAGSARTVTARAATDLTVVRFPPEQDIFRSWLEKCPSIGSRLLFSFIADIADRTRKANTLLKENSPQIQELRRQVYEDKLTGLKNRVFLEEQLPAIIASAKNEETSLLMFKPDNFKQVNDHAGHEAGDTLLVNLARRFPSILAQDILLIRYAGNEFGLVLKGVGRKGAVEMAEKVQAFYNALDLASFLPVSGIHLTVSTGIAVYPEHANQAKELIEKAHGLPLVGRARGGNKILFPEDAAEGSA
jgi:diguanylate cyclase (GGDEF) domain